MSVNPRIKFSLKNIVVEKHIKFSLISLYIDSSS